MPHIIKHCVVHCPVVVDWRHPENVYCVNDRCPCMRIAWTSAFMGLLLVVWHLEKNTVVKNYLYARAIGFLLFTNLCCFSMRGMDTQITHLWAHTATPVDWVNRLCFVVAVPVQWASYKFVKMQVAHASGMPGTFSPPQTWKETIIWRSQHASRHVHHAGVVMHVGIANQQWRGKRSQHSQRMLNPQFHVSGKRPMRKWK